jgi:D-amino peptidase
MLAGLDDDTDAVLFVGYHGQAGSGPAVFAHTMSEQVLDVRFDGRSLGEIGLNAAMAGHHGAPVIFLSGDEAACQELHQLVPDATTVAVKRALGQAAAETLHPEEAREQLTRAAATAVRQRERLKPVSIIEAAPTLVEIDLYRPHVVDLAAIQEFGARAVPAPSLSRLAMCGRPTS